MNKIIGALRSKTMYLSLAVVIMGAVQMALPLVADIVHPKVHGLITVFVGLTIGLLRWVTTVPLEEKA